MNAVSTITSTDTATIPMSQPISSAPRRSSADRERARRGPSSRENFGAPSSGNAGVNLARPQTDARLIIPAVSLRSALSTPTREERIASLHDVPAYLPPTIVTDELTRGPRSAPTFIALPRLTEGRRNEPTTAVRRGAWDALVSALAGRKQMVAAFGMSAALVGLGAIFSTTETAQTLASRIQLGFEHEAPIPAAAADSTPISLAVAEAPAMAAAPESVAAPAEVVDLEAASANAPVPMANPVVAKASPARVAPRPAPHVVHSAAAASAPIRLRSPY